MADQELSQGQAEGQAPETPVDGGQPEVDQHAALRALPPDELIKAIEDLRKENAKVRNKAKAEAEKATAIEARIAQEAEERRKAELTELDRLKEELEQAKKAQADVLANLETEKVNRGIIASLNAKGYKFHREDEILQFADRSLIEKGTTGEPAGFESIAEKLYQERPHFFDRGVRSPAVPGGGPGDTAPKRLSNEELIALSQRDPKAAKAALKERGYPI